MNKHQPKVEGVVLLHGICHSAFGMRGLSKFLTRSGFKVLNLDYPSTRYSLESLVEIIHGAIKTFSASLEGPIHFVGYSMGGLLIRAYLKKYKPAHLGRVVMIGPPNHGSELADFLKDFKLYKKLFGPAGQQLITNQIQFKHIFCDTNFDVGIIAGKNSYFFSRYFFDTPNDGQVSIESTHLDKSQDHITVCCNHLFLPIHKPAWNQVLHFLHSGHFDSSASK